VVGGGVIFLARVVGAKPWVILSRRRHCGAGDRGAAVLWPDQAIRGRAARGPAAIPEEKTWRISLAQEAGLVGRRKGNPSVQMGGHRTPGPDNARRQDDRVACGSRRRAWSKRSRDRIQRMRGDQSDRPGLAPVRDGKFTLRWSATLADEAMSDRQQRLARHRAGEKATCALTPSPSRWSRLQLRLSRAKPPRVRRAA